MQGHAISGITASFYCERERPWPDNSHTVLNEHKSFSEHPFRPLSCSNENCDPSKAQGGVSSMAEMHFFKPITVTGWCKMS